MKFGLFWITLITYYVASVRRVVANEHQLVVQVPGYSPKEDDAYIGVSIKATAGYIVRFEPFAHADRIHHMLLYGCDKPAYDSSFWEGGATCAGASHILYAWARNAPSLSLPEGVGFAIGNKGDPVQYIVLQVHYAHPFSGNVRDFAGVTMHLVDTRPANLAAVYLFVSGEAIPPRRDVALNNISCTYDGDAELTPFAFRTHTHQMGRVVSAYFKRSGQWTQIGKRNPQWPQLFQKIDKKIVIKKGDFMAATCRFDSHDKAEFTPMGSMGTAEMCNFYMMFYRSADSQDPFPWGGGCGGNENEELVAAEYPKDGVSLLPKHPEWEHVAHQMDKPFGVKQRLGVSKVGDHKLGQISGLSYGKDGSLYLFHRSERIWDGSTFDQYNKLQDESAINDDVLLHVDVGIASLKLRSSYGKNQFYLPHGVFVDDSDYIYTTDVGSHQVIKWKVESGNLKPVFTLGEKFQPGSDTNHFCKPSGVAVSRNDGFIYVSDGYCNNRVMVFDKNGKFIQQFGSASTMGREASKPQLGTFFLPHDIVLDNKLRRIFVADRENGRVQIFNQSGVPVQDVSYPSLFRDVYSADYDEEHGLIMIPGSRITENAQIEAFVCPAPSFKLQFSFRPTDSSFKRPHIIRIRDNVVAIGEIAEEGGRLSIFDIVTQGHHPQVSSKELYRSPDDVNDAGSPFFITLLVIASVLIACFVAYMRYRDVSDGNIVDRTGFKPLKTDDIPSDNSDEEEEYSRARP
uniref:Peptidylglycine monooxygenase n=2 Tax=Bursaphelenchus xylophilus TaxID=6326 RepID=A0A1I7S7E0_BURXY